MNRGMGTGLIAFGGVLAVVGAILRFAVELDPTGFDIHTAGMILLLVGIALIVAGGLTMAFGGRTTTTTQESVQNTAGGQVRTTEQDARTTL